MTEIYIEGQRLDIDAGISSLLTFAIDDVKDFASRNSNFSKTIVLPGTARNNQLFGHIFSVQNGNFYNPSAQNVGYNFNAAVGARCLIFQNKVQQFKGILRLMEVIVDRGAVEYEVAVFGELANLILKLGNKKLEELDFSAYDEVYNSTNVVASWDNPGGSGLYYPHIDYGTYGSGTGNKHDWDIRTFRPSLYVKEYLDKIFAAAGYTYESSLFNTTRFKKLIVPHNRKKLTKIGTLVGVATGQFITSDYTAPEFKFINLTYTGVTGSFVLAPDSVANQAIKYTGTEDITLLVNIKFTGIYQSQFGVQLRVFSGTLPFGVDYIEIPPNPNYPASDPYEVNWTSPPLTFSTNDQISFDIAWKIEGGTDPLTNTSTFSVDPFFVNLNTASAAPVEINPGDTILINDTIPQNILQKDFFASIVKLFNLYVYEDTDKTNHLKIEPYVDFFDVNDTGEDWTYKLNHDKPVKIKPMSELNARYYEFRFKSDADYYNDLYRKRYNEGYGDRIFDSEFEFTAEKNVAEIIFSATPLVGYLGEDKIYSTIFKQTNNQEETIDSNIRILQTAKVSGVTAWSIKNASGVLTSGLTTYGYAGHLNDPDVPSNDIQFGVPRELFFTLVTGDITVNQFNVYWSPYMAEITDKDSKLLTGFFKFTPDEMYAFDFSRYIYLWGTLWRVNKIEDYNPEQPDESAVQLLKVGYKEY